MAEAVASPFKYIKRKLRDKKMSLDSIKEKCREVVRGRAVSAASTLSSTPPSPSTESRKGHSLRQQRSFLGSAAWRRPRSRESVDDFGNRWSRIYLPGHTQSLPEQVPGFYFSPSRRGSESEGSNPPESPVLGYFREDYSEMATPDSPHLESPTDQRWGRRPEPILVPNCDCPHCEALYTMAYLDGLFDQNHYSSNQPQIMEVELSPLSMMQACDVANRAHLWGGWRSSLSLTRSSSKPELRRTFTRSEDSSPLPSPICPTTISSPIPLGETYYALAVASRSSSALPPYPIAI